MKIIRFQKLNSTQEYAKSNISSIITPSIIIAKEQEDGKGRLGRNFYSPEGGLYFTFIIDWDNPYLSMIVPLSITEALDEIGIPTEILWPNDILYNGKKISGILIEKIGEKNLIGVGINCNNKITDFPEELRETITTIYEIKKTKIDTEKLCVSIVQNLLSISNYGEIKGMFLKRMKGKNERVKIRMDDKSVIEGSIYGISDTGGLLIKREGKILEIKSAEKLFLLT